MGNFLSVVGMRDGKGKAFWKVANTGDLGIFSTLRTNVTVPQGQEMDTGWGARWRLEVSVVRRSQRGFWPCLG